MDGDHLSLNRISWDFANRRFNKVKGDFARAIRSGVEVMPREVVDHIVMEPGRKLLHLMCNDGREAAFLGWQSGVSVVGVDFSAPAIDFACQLNEELGLGNRFVRAEILEWLKRESKEEFDTVLLTPGSIRWLEDLPQFFALARRLMKINGQLILWDFHPILHCFDGDLMAVLDYPFDSRSYVRDAGVADYASDENDFHLVARSGRRQRRQENIHKVYFSGHSMGTIVDGALRAGFRLVSFKEFPFCWEERHLPWLVETEDRRFEAPLGATRIPMTFLVKLKKEEEGWQNA